MGAIASATSHQSVDCNTLAVHHDVLQGAQHGAHESGERGDGGGYCSIVEQIFGDVQEHELCQSRHLRRQLHNAGTFETKDAAAQRVSGHTGVSEGQFVGCGNDGKALSRTPAG